MKTEIFLHERCSWCLWHLECLVCAAWSLTVALIRPTGTSCREGGLVRQEKSLTRLQFTFVSPWGSFLSFLYTQRVSAMPRNEWQFGWRQPKKILTRHHLGEGQVERLVPQGRRMPQLLQQTFAQHILGPSLVLDLVLLKDLVPDIFQTGRCFGSSH